MKNLPSGVTIPGGGGSGVYAELQLSLADESVHFTSGVSDNDQFLAAVGNQFTLVSTADFDLTPEGGVITYTGSDTIQVLAWGMGVLTNTELNPSFATIKFLGISKNGQFINEAPFASAFQALGGCVYQVGINNGNGGTTDAVNCCRLLELEENDTIQLVGGQSFAAELLLEGASLLLLKVA